MSTLDLADAIREAAGVRYGDVDPERLAVAIIAGALAEAGIPGLMERPHAEDEEFGEFFHPYLHDSGAVWVVAS